MGASVVGSLGIIQGPGGLGSETGAQLQPSSTALSGSVDQPPATPAALDDEFTGTALNSKWSLLNGGFSPVAFDGATNGFLTLPFTAARSLKAITQPISVLKSQTLWSVTAKIQPSGLWYSSAVGVAQNTTSAFGILLYESASGKGVLYNILGISSTTIERGVYSSLTAAVYTALSSGFPIANSVFPNYLRVSFDNTNYYAWLSLTGRTWWRLDTLAKGTDFTVQADTIGIGGDSNGAVNSQAITTSIDWIRDTTSLLVP